MTTAVPSVLLGQMIRLPDRVRSWVVRQLICSTHPACKRQTEQDVTHGNQFFRVIDVKESTPDPVVE